MPEALTRSASTAPAPAAASIDDTAQEIDERLELLKSTYPAALVLVRSDDETRFIAAGTASRGGDELTERHRFPAGSVSKTMLAVAVLQLVEDGVLTLDDTVEEWLPGLVPAGDEISVEQLLSHRSGLYSYTDVGSFDFTVPGWTPEELIEVATAKRPLSRPGEESNYTNTNYVVLGLIVEKVTGQPLEQVLRERIFEPTRMTDTSMSPERLDGPLAVRGYAGRRDVTPKELSWAWGAGAVVSSARDLDRFLQALAGNELLDATTLADMQTWRGELVDLGDIPYGLGIGELDVQCDAEMVGHNGSVPGFIAEAWTTADGSRSVVAMVNSQESGDAAAQLVYAAVCD